MLLSLALSLGLTLILELGVAAILGIRRARDLLMVTLVNVLTNPIVVLVLNLALLRGGPSWYLVAALEISAVGVEGLLYRNRLETPWNPFLLSLILNATSFFGGLLL
mgnify:CR=1 FL=1